MSLTLRDDSMTSNG